MAEDEVVRTEQVVMQRLRDTFGGKPWIIGGEVAQGIMGGALMLQSLGASDVIAIASRSGVGELSDDVRFIFSDSAQVGDGASMVARMHDNNRELHNLPAWVIAEVDEWDPEHRANAVVSFTIDAGLVAGRPTFGARELHWAALEDKIAIRSIWADAGVTTAPDRVVRLDDIDALLLAQRAIGSRWGTVWAVDNEQGWHGGGKGTYWVPTEEGLPAKAAELATSHQRVRVQPFLEGVPCSVHGMVLRDATLAFRPCEMIVLLDVDANTFEYSRAATFWDPSDADREDMRAAARAIGDVMRDRVDYRGVFTVDGVMTADGFRPTEVNPRFGAALPPRLPTADGGALPLFFFHLAAVAGDLDNLDPHAIEDLIVRRLDENRIGTAFIPTPHAPPNDEQLKVTIAGTWTDGSLTHVRAADASDTHDTGTAFATAVWGADPAGGLIFVTFAGAEADGALPIGPAVAPTVVAIRSFLARHWDIALAELRPAFGE